MTKKMKHEPKKLSSKFLLIWFGQFISMIGSGVTIFSLGVYVYQQTHTASSFTLILLCVFLPPFLLKPLGGILADRYDRCLMMLVGDLGATLGLLFIFFMMLMGSVELWQIYLGIAISSIFSAFQGPAYKALVTDLIPEVQYAKASGLVQLAGSAQYLISPFLAGILLIIIDIKFIFIIDVTTFLFAGATIIWIRKILGKTKTKQLKQSYFSDFKEGIQEFSKKKGVVRLVGITMIVLFFVGLLQALLIPMLLSLTSPTTAGITQSICASGMLIGSLFIGLFGSKSKHVKVLSISLFLAGLFFANLGLSTSIIFITIAGFIFFSVLPFINTSIEVLIRRNIDNGKQGRVWSIISTITYLGSIVAFIVAGFLADKVVDPLLEENGKLAETVGSIIGIGKGRGIGLIFIISGTIISCISLLIFRNKFINSLDKN